MVGDTSCRWPQTAASDTEEFPQHVPKPRPQCPQKAWVCRSEDYRPFDINSGSDDVRVSGVMLCRIHFASDAVSTRVRIICLMCSGSELHRAATRQSSVSVMPSADKPRHVESCKHCPFTAILWTVEPKLSSHSWLWRVSVGFDSPLSHFAGLLTDAEENGLLVPNPLFLMGICRSLSTLSSGCSKPVEDTL